MTGLVLNSPLETFIEVEFDYAVDHRTLPYIIQRIYLQLVRLLIRLSFNLYYVKGKDMMLCDYLSRIAVDKGDPGEVIPISFNALAQYRLALDYITESYDN